AEARLTRDLMCMRVSNADVVPRTISNLQAQSLLRCPEARGRVVPMKRFFIMSSLIGVAIAGTAVPHAQQDLVARARAIHDRVIALDTHNDIDPQNFTTSCNYTMRLTTQVNLPKMKEGGLDVSFFIVYVGQGDLTP